MDIQFLQPITFSKILVLRAFAHITVIRICTCVNFEFWVPIQPNHFLDSSIVRSKTKIDVDLLGDLSKPINQSYPLRENVQKSKTSLKQCILTMFLQRTAKCEKKHIFRNTFFLQIGYTEEIRAVNYQFLCRNLHNIGTNVCVKVCIKPRPVQF